MDRPRGEVSAWAGPFHAASRRTGRDGFPIIRLSSDYCVSGTAGCPALALTQDTQHRCGVLHYAYPVLLVSDHLAPFAVWAAFPPSLAGRYSGDYYEASVAIGLASHRRSRVRPCCTCQRDVGVPLISLNTLAGRRPALRRLRHTPSIPTQSTAPVSAVISGGWKLASTGD
jgi:hypothetical protein